MRYKNNPLNIRYNKNNSWIGQCGQKNGFCEFQTFGLGLRAAVIILTRYNRLGKKSIGDIVSTWAPKSDNNPTDNYIKFVCDFMNRNTKKQFIDDFSLIKEPVLYSSDFQPSEPYDVGLLLCAMATFEQGQKFLPYFDEFVFAAFTYFCKPCRVNPYSWVQISVK